MVFPREEPDGCCDIDEERRAATGICGHGYVPLSHSGTRRYENWTNSISTETPFWKSFFFRVGSKQEGIYFLHDPTKYFMEM